MRNDSSHIHLKGSVKTQDVNSKDNNSYTPLHFACLDQKILAIIDLLEWNADPNVVGRMGIRPIHLCCPPLMFANPYSFKLDPSTFKIPVTALTRLLTYKADINAVDQFGSTVLHFVAFTDCTPLTIQLLLDAGIDKHLLDRNGMTACKVAAKQCHWDIADMLDDSRPNHTTNIPRSDLALGQTTIDGIGEYTKSVKDCLQRSGEEMGTADDFAAIGLLTPCNDSQANMYVKKKIQDYF